MTTKMASFSDIIPKHRCTYCEDEIIGIRVKCVECDDFDLCLQCFSSGAEIGPHKNDHSYQFVDPGAVEVFKSKTKWTAREELDLLTGIEQYGFGNWEKISEHITTRTPDEAREEYTSRYVEGSIGRFTWQAAYAKRAKMKDFGADLPPVPQTPDVMLPLEIPREQAAILGFMPNRGDFEWEFQNDAESFVSRLNLNFTYGSDLDVALTLVHVDCYMERLRERARRKKIVNDYQLISKFFSDRRDRHTRRRGSLEQEIEDKLKCFCRLQSVESHNSLVRGIIRQRELSIRMSELLRYRRAGLTHLEELPHYEQEIAQSRGSDSSSVCSHQTQGKRNGANGSEANTPFSTIRKSTPPTDSPGSSQGTERWQQLLLLGSIATPDSSHLLSNTETQNPEEEPETNKEKVIQNYIKSNGWYISSS